jgi:prolipoprotein diacylglyceryltransferase
MMHTRSLAVLVLFAIAALFVVAAAVEFRNVARSARVERYIFWAILFALLGAVIYFDPLQRLHHLVTGH